MISTKADPPPIGGMCRRIDQIFYDLAAVGASVNKVAEMNDGARNARGVRDDRAVSVLEQVVAIVEVGDGVGQQSGTPGMKAADGGCPGSVRRLEVHRDERLRGSSPPTGEQWRQAWPRPRPLGLFDLSVSQTG